MAPWNESDAARHTRKAKSGKARKQWAAVSNSILKKTGDEGRAVRGANSVIKKRGLKRKRSQRSTGRK